ncbi:hypothetical protein ABZ807_19575 [Micromonospora sp. NPDC047548]|uniref:hypothetical protein n=1 Tax=Micromonospora sp. NPDC047548 TaxID=3155624 RepID=UPI003408462F
MPYEYNSIEYSRQARWLLQIITGEDQPGAMEGRLRASGDVLQSTADDMRELSRLLAGGVDRIRRGMKGDVEQAFTDRMRKLLAEGGTLDNVSLFFGGMGERLRTAAGQVQYMKMSTAQMLAEMLFQIALLIYLSNFFPGWAQAMLLQRLLAARIFYYALQTRVGQGLTALLISTAQEFGQDLLLQVIQKNSGWRRNLSVQDLGQSAVGGVFGGVAALALAPAVQGLLGKMMRDPTAWRGQLSRESLEGVGVEVLAEGATSAAYGQGFVVTPFSVTSGLADSVAPFAVEKLAEEVRERLGGSSDDDDRDDTRDDNPRSQGSPGNNGTPPLGSDGSADRPLPREGTTGPTRDDAGDRDPRPAVVPSRDDGDDTGGGDSPPVVVPSRNNGAGPVRDGPGGGDPPPVLVPSWDDGVWPVRVDALGDDSWPVLVPPGDGPGPVVPGLGDWALDGGVPTTVGSWPADPGPVLVSDPGSNDGWQASGPVPPDRVVAPSLEQVARFVFPDPVGAPPVVVGGLGEGVGAPVPRVVHLVWTDAGVAGPQVQANVRDWVEYAGRQGWTVRLWVGGDPAVQGWWTGTGVEVSRLDPVTAQWTGGTTGPTPARWEGPGWVDAARLAVLHHDGGASVDVHTPPGSVSLPVTPVRLGDQPGSVAYVSPAPTQSSAGWDAVRHDPVGLRPVLREALTGPATATVLAAPPQHGFVRDVLERVLSSQPQPVGQLPTPTALDPIPLASTSRRADTTPGQPQPIPQAAAEPGLVMPTGPQGLDTAVDRVLHDYAGPAGHVFDPRLVAQFEPANPLVRMASLTPPPTVTGGHDLQTAAFDAHAVPQEVRPQEESAVYDVDAVWVHPFTGVRTRAAFDARFRTEDGRPVTELTVKVRIVPDETVTETEVAETWDSLHSGVEEYFNQPGHQFRKYGTLKVTVEPVTDGPAHLQVELSHLHPQISQRKWRPGMDGQEAAHELGHQLGLREENRHPDDPEELLHVPGSLMGQFDDPVPREVLDEAGLEGPPQGGVRQRYLDLVERLIDARRDGGRAPQPSPHTGDDLPEPRMPSLDAVNRRVARMEDQRLIGPLRDLVRDQPGPLTPAEARLWVDSTTMLPGNPNPSTAQKWEYLRQLEQLNRAIPTPAEQQAGMETPVRQSVLATRDRRPWLEDGTPQPPIPTGTITFADSHVLPKAMPSTPGRDRPSFKLVDEIAQHISQHENLPRPATDTIAKELREHPEQFFGEGYRLQVTRDGKEREIIVRATNYGDWSRYSAEPTLKPEPKTVASAVAKRALTLNRQTDEKVRHIDNVHFLVTDVTDVHNPAAGTHGASFTMHNGLNWHLSRDYTAPLDPQGLPQDIVFTEEQPVGEFEVEGVGAPLRGAAELARSLFPDLTSKNDVYRQLHNFFAHGLGDAMPEMLRGWTEVPGANPPGVRIRAIPEDGRLAHSSQQPPVRPRARTTSDGLGNLAKSVFDNLSESGERLMRDESGWYGVYDTRVRLEIQRLDGEHQPLGTSGRSTYMMASPVAVRMRMGTGEATRHATAPTQIPAPPPQPEPQPVPDPARLASVLVHGGDRVMVGLSEPVDPHPAVRGVGVPKAALPHMEQVLAKVKSLGEAAGVPIPRERLRTLSKELLDNYPQLVGGALVDLGKAEALITIDPTHPWKVANPSGSFDRPSEQSGAFPGSGDGEVDSPTGSGGNKGKAREVAEEGGQSDGGKPDGGFHSNETINGRFLTGTHNTTHSGTMGVTNANAAVSFGFGVGPGPAQVAKGSVALNATMNKVSKSLTVSEDAETGMVEDTRDTSTLLAYVPNWRVQLRTDADIRWENVPYHAVDGPLDEKLLLWVNDHYLRDAPAQTVTVQNPADGPIPAPTPPQKPAGSQPQPPAAPTPEATRQYEDDLRAWEDGQREYFDDLGQYYSDWNRYLEHIDTLAHHDDYQRSLPDILYASGLTDLPRLFDNIVAELKVAGLALPMGSPQRTQLWQKLSNLDTNLKKAVNQEEGYHFTIAESGQELAEITVRTTRDDSGEQVGDTTDKAHLEEVRTAIEGVSGNQSISQSTAVTVSGGADVVPTDLMKVTAMGYGSMSWSNSTSFGSGRTGLWVLVSRYTGYTSGYQVKLTHNATVSVAKNAQADPRPVPEVSGSGLLRIPEPDAFKHGFPVAKDALTDPSNPRPAPGAVRNTAPQPEDPKAAPLPLHVLNGKGVGHGLTKVDRAVIRQIKEGLEGELRRAGFLPADRDRPFASGKGKRDSRIDNANLLDKMVSEAGFDSHYDPMHQDGLTFTLTLRHKGGFKTYARVTVKAEQRLEGYEDHEGNRHSQYHVRRSDEYHTVNLAMGMDSAAPGVGGGKRAAIGFKATLGYNGDDPKYKWFRGYTAGAEYSRGVGASEGLFLMVNRPELLEYPGAVDMFRLPSDYTVTIEYSDTELGVPRPIEVKDALATVHLLPSFNNPAKAGQSTFSQPTPKEVIDQAVILYVDSSGMTEAIRELLPDLAGPGKINDDAMSKFGGNVLVRSHLKEIIYHEYNTSHFFDPGFWRDGTASVALSADMQPSRFAGFTADKFVIGRIKLWLSQATQTESKSHGVSVTPLSVSAGGSFPGQGNLDLTGSANSNLSWGWATSESTARTGAKEFLELDFHRVYAFATKVDFKLDAVHEKHGKLAWASIRTPDQDTLADKEMLYLLSEHDALTEYAKNKVPVPDELVHDALIRWHDGELQLSGNTVAGILARRASDLALRPELGGWSGADRLPLAEWARIVREKHNNGELYVTGATAERFNQAFPRFAIDNGSNPFADRWIPPYLTRTGPKALGHSGIHELNFDADPARGIPENPTPFTLVRDMVERAAPGLLGKQPEVWLSDNGRIIGRLQGGVDGLQGLLSGKREQPLVEDMLHKDGFTLVFTNQVGPVLHDVVEVNLKYALTGKPEVTDLVPETGLENYTHGYDIRSKTKAKDFTYSAGASLSGKGPIGHHNPNDPKNDLPKGSLSATPGLKVGAGSHKSVTRAQTETTEQTIYDWTGHYRADVRHNLHVEVRRVDMAGRPLNNLLTGVYRKLAGHAEPVVEDFAGTTVLKIPKSTGDAKPMSGPHLPDYRALVAWPGDGYVTAVLVDDAPAMARELLADLAGKKANDPDFLSSLSLPIELSRTHLQGHLHEAIGGNEYLLSDKIFLPGHSSDRVRMSLVGDLYNPEIIAPISGTGPGAYRKTQDGTTFSYSSDSPRAGWSLGTEGGGAAHIKDFDNQTKPWASDSVGGSAGTGADHTHNQGTSHTENYRREQHVKQQGPTYLVRLRGKFRFVAQRHTVNLVLPDTKSGWKWSDPFSGDVYALLTAGELHELQQRMDNLPSLEQTGTDPTTWPRPGQHPRRRNLVDLLADVGRDGYDQFQAAGEVAQSLRADVGGGPRRSSGRPHSGLVLTSRDGQAIVHTYEATLTWAQQELAGLGNSARSQLDEVRGRLAQVAGLRRLAKGRASADAAAQLTDAEEYTDQITNQIIALQGDSWAESLRRRNLPPVDLHPVDVGRQVAHELETYVDVHHTDINGVTAKYRIDPDGRVADLSDEETAEPSGSRNVTVPEDQGPPPPPNEPLQQQPVTEGTTPPQLPPTAPSPQPMPDVEDMTDDPAAIPMTRLYHLDPLAAERDQSGARVVQQEESAVYDVDAVWVHPFTGVRTRAAFDVRFGAEDGRPVTELAVRVRIVPDETVTEAEVAEAWDALRGGVEEYFNQPGYQFRKYGTLKVMVEPVTDGPAHLRVELSHLHSEITQSKWRPGMSGQESAHEFGHQLGLREENRHPDDPEGLLHVPGSLMGQFDEAVPREVLDEAGPEGVSQGGVRQRYLDLVERLIDARRDGGRAPQPSPHTVDDLPEPLMPSLNKVNERVARMEEQQFIGPLRDLVREQSGPLSPAEALLWVDSTTTLPGNPHPTVAQKWEYLRQLEQLNRAIPTPAEQQAGMPTPVRQSVLATRDRRPWLEDGTPPPSTPTGVIQFGDNHVLPAAMPSAPGRDRPSFKLSDEIAQHIGEQDNLPRPVTDTIATELREYPEQFFGEGYRLQFTRDGKEREIIVRATNHGDWSRYSGEPTFKPELKTVASTVAKRALTFNRQTDEKVRHIDNVHFLVTDVTDVHNPAAATHGASFTVHNGLNWHLSRDYTTPLDPQGLPQDIVFTGTQPIGDMEVEGVSAPLHGAAELARSVFPDLTSKSEAYQQLHDFLAHKLTEHMPEMLQGWTDVPGANPPGVRIRAIPEDGRLAHTSQQPPVRPQARTTPHGPGNLANSVLKNLSRSGETLMRDDSGRYGIYDTRVRLEIQRLDGEHQPLGTSGRSTYMMASPVAVRMRMGTSEATRHATAPTQTPPPQPVLPTGATQPVSQQHQPAPQPEPVSDPARLASVLVHGGDQVMVALSEPVNPHPAVRGVGVPKAGLPHMGQVLAKVRDLGEAAGVTIPRERLRTLSKELLDNYPQLVGGALIDLGKAEALITIDPTHPWKVVNPSGSFDRPSEQSGAFPEDGDGQPDGGKPDGGFHSNETINGRFLTGTHNTTHSGTMGVTNVNASVSVGIGVGPGPAQVAKGSVALNATMNKVSKSLTVSEDAETGMVEDTRDVSTLLAYVPNWRVQLRTDVDIRWENVPYHAVDGPLEEKLLLWVNDHYLRDAPAQTVSLQKPSGSELPERPTDPKPRPPVERTLEAVQQYEADLRVWNDQQRDYRVKLGEYYMVETPDLPQRPTDPKPQLPAQQTPEATGQYAADLRAWDDRQREYFDELGQYYADWNRYLEHIDTLAHHDDNQRLLPDILYASGITDLPRLFDNIVAELKEAGLSLPMGSSQRTQLWQKLSNLDTNLKKAVNQGEGYHFTIAESGHELAEITIRTTRDDSGEQVGDTTNKAHLEEVRTAIEGVSGSQSISQSTAVTVSGGADVVPTDLMKVTATGYGSMSWSNSTNFGSGRTGLWVLVSRYTGYTSGYQVKLTHHATVSVAKNAKADPRPVPEVSGSGLLRIPEPDAFKHGFPVAEEALTDPSDPSAPGAIRNTGPKPEDPKAAPLPLHVLEGKGVGHGLTKVDRAAIDEIKEGLEGELRRSGFLPPDRNRPFASSEGKRDSRIDNANLLDKMVSEAGFDSHYDPMHQDGLTFTLTLRHKGGFKTYARVTVKAEQHLEGYEDHEGKRHSQYFVRRSDEYHTVNLAMGMDSAAPGVGGGKRAAVGVRATLGYGGDEPKYKWFRGYTAGAEYSRGVSASEGLFLMVNRPELLEYPGAVDVFRLPSDYLVTIEYSDSKLGVPRPIAVKDALATVHLLPSFNNPAKAGQSTFSQPTSREVIDQAVILYVDSSGMTEAIRTLLPDLAGPGKINDDAMSKFGGNVLVRSHLKEIIYHEYNTSHFFDSGFWRDGTASVALSADMQPSRFAGFTADKFVIGKIKLWLSQATQTESKSHGLSVTPLSVSAGGSFPEHGNLDLTGSANGNLSWGRATSESTARTGAKEFLELDFHRVYAFATKVDFKVDAVHEKHGKLAWSSIRTPDQDTLGDKEMLYLLSEHDALTEYAKNKVPVPDELVHDALMRWYDGELQLSGNTVAGILARRMSDLSFRPELGGWNGADRLPLAEWARIVQTKHNNGELYITGDAATRFNTAFPERQLGDGINPFADRWIPPYLTRTGPKALGHSGIHELNFDADPARGIPENPTPFTLVRDMVERAAPGLLGKQPEVWLSDNGRIIGRLQGGVDGLQGLLSGKREQPLVEDMLHKDGFTLVFTNRIGGLLHDVVEVNMKYQITSMPEVNDLVPETGLENYTHGYDIRAKTEARDFTYSAGGSLTGGGPVGHQDPGDPKGSLSTTPGLKVGAGSHKNVTRAHTETTEQTIYDWTGHYRADVRHNLQLEVRRVDMAGRSLNNLFTGIYRDWTGHAQPVVEDFAGTTVLKIPKSTGDAKPMVGPQPPDYRALVAWPGDGYVTAVLVDDAPAMARELLADLAGKKANDPGFLSSLSLPIELSRTHLQGHLHEAIGGNEYLLSDKIFLPGHGSDRVRMSLVGDLYNPEIIAPISGTGPGAYRKTQDGTTFSYSSDSPRAGWSIGAGGSGDPANGDTVGGSAGTGADHTHNQGTSHTENYRREQHVKQQGPTYLVRLRGKFRLVAQRHTVNIVLPDTKSGWKWSDPFSGDVYALLTAGELHEVQQRMDHLPPLEQTGTDPTTWPRPGQGAPRRNLVKLLAEVGRDGYNQFQAAGEVAQRLRADIGGGPRPSSGRTHSGLVLTSRDGQAIVHTYEATLTWAQEELASLGNSARSQLDEVQDRLARVAGLRRLANGRPSADTAAQLTDAKNFTTQITNQITALRGDSWNDSLGRRTLPPVGLGPVAVGRQVAHELETYVDVHHTDVNGVTTRYRIDPEGRTARLGPDGRPAQLGTDDTTDTGGSRSLTVPEDQAPPPPPNAPLQQQPVTETSTTPPQTPQPTVPSPQLAPDDADMIDDPTAIPMTTLKPAAESAATPPAVEEPPLPPSQEPVTVTQEPPTESTETNTTPSHPSNQQPPTSTVPPEDEGTVREISYDTGLGPNPNLYSDHDGRFRVSNTTPGAEWYPAGQFCAYLATHWLVNGAPPSGLRFGDLSEPDRDAAVLSHLVWAERGGLDAQVDQARETLSGQSLGTVRLLAAITNETWPPGTRIWLGNRSHTLAAVVGPDNRFQVYDPNTGDVTAMTVPDFRAYVRAIAANSFVVAEPKPVPATAGGVEPPGPLPEQDRAPVDEVSDLPGRPPEESPVPEQLEADNRFAGQAAAFARGEPRTLPFGMVRYAASPALDDALRAVEPTPEDVEQRLQDQQNEEIVGATRVARVLAALRGVRPGSERSDEASAWIEESLGGRFHPAEVSALHTLPNGSVTVVQLRHAASGANPPFHTLLIERAEDGRLYLINALGSTPVAMALNPAPDDPLLLGQLQLVMDPEGRLCWALLPDRLPMPSDHNDR